MRPLSLTMRAQVLGLHTRHFTQTRYRCDGNMIQFGSTRQERRRARSPSPRASLSQTLAPCHCTCISASVPSHELKDVRYVRRSATADIQPVVLAPPPVPDSGFIPRPLNFWHRAAPCRRIRRAPRTLVCLDLLHDVLNALVKRSTNQSNEATNQTRPADVSWA